MRLSQPTRFFLVIALGIVALGALFPMAWMASSSIKTQGEIYQDPPTWVPVHPTLDNYNDLFYRFHFGILTRNSIVISLGMVGISLVLGAMAAYGFSRYHFRWSNILLGGLLITRMITPSSLVVPLFSIMEKLGRLNHLDPIIAGITVLNLPFVIWIMKPFFDELPREVEEAGELDGLTPVSVFWRIAIPMAAPGLYAILLFSFISGWVDLLFGMSFSTIPEAEPLTVGLMQMQTGYQIYWGAMMAGGVYITLPVFILALVFQKYLVRGMRAGY